MTSPRYTKAGLSVNEAMVLAAFIGWQMAVANAADTIGKEAALKIAGDAGRNIDALMLDETLEWGEDKFPVALVDTETGGRLAELLALSLENLADRLEAKFSSKEETYNAAV